MSRIIRMLEMAYLNWESFWPSQAMMSPCLEDVVFFVVWLRVEIADIDMQVGKKT